MPGGKPPSGTTPRSRRSAEQLRQALGWQPVARPVHPVLFINPRSGGGTAARLALADHARDLGVETIVLEPDHDLATLVVDAVDRGADALGMAGGDGSMAVVAAAACAHDLPFVCVPAGTRNHFALDLGVQRNDVVGALEAFTDGLERRIDLGEINGSVFLDNVVLGFYGDAVRQEGYRDARLRTMLASARDALGPRAPAPGSSLSTIGAGSIAIRLSSWSPTTPTRWTARSRARHGRDSTPAGSGSSPSTGRPCPVPTGRGRRRHSRSRRPRPSTLVATARPSRWSHRCVLPFGRARSACGSPRGTRAPPPRRN